MHLVISHAAAPGPRCRAASTTLQLPHLQALMQRAGRQSIHTGTSDSLNPLAEHLASGQSYEDGLVPWAAWLAQAKGLHARGQHWALISPCHLQIHSDHVAMQDPTQWELPEDQAYALLAAMQPYFADDGIALHWHSAQTWLAQGPIFEGLCTASLARVRAQAIDPWIPRQSAAQNLRRLQNEMQMLLYTHVVNDTRSARSQVPINGFWISGTGSPLVDDAITPPSAETLQVLQALQALPEPMQSTLGPVTPNAIYVNALDASALQDDAQAWTQAWQTLDSQVLAPLASQQSGAALRISLCGTQRARSFHAGQASLWQRMQQKWSRPGLHHFTHDL